MARVYHVDIARFAAEADSKWVDNLLSHHDVPGVEGRRQGSARRVSELGIYHIALIRALSRDAGMSTAAAVATAGQLLAADAESRTQLAAGLELRFDRSSFERHVDGLIAEAIESVIPARRGRPPRARNGP